MSITKLSDLIRKCLPAINYYIGRPDGRFFDEATFGSAVARAKKAYVTLNTLMGVLTAELDRHSEGKKQTSELLTVLAVKKMVEMYMDLCRFALGTMDRTTEELVRACRQTEISEGESTVMALTSTTKLSVPEIMKLGYGYKNKLAIVKYRLHPGALVCDMEELGEDYGKPDEREVLLLTGNKLVARCIGYDDNYRGKDDKPALVYIVDVYPPEPVCTGEEELEALRNVVFDEKSVCEIQEFYKNLNNFDVYPAEPDCYRNWKESFQKLVYAELMNMLIDADK